MRPSTRTAPDLLARTALLLALVAPCATLTADDRSADGLAPRAEAPQIRLIRHESRPNDPERGSGLEQVCGDDAAKGDCEIVLQRLGRKPVVGVLFAPDPGGGVRIAGVTPDGAAAGAGLKSGDRLLRIAGKPVVGDTPDARVDNARLQLQGLDDKTAVKLSYVRDGREQTVSVTPKLDERIMLFSGDGTVLRPGGNVILRRVDGRTQAQADSLDIETLIDGRAVGDGPRIHVVSADADDPPRGERRVIRIDCKDDDAACRKQAELRIGRPLPAFVGADAIRSASVFRLDCKPGETCPGQARLADAFRWNGLNLASVDAQLGRYFGTDTGVLVLSTGPALGQLQAGDVIRRVDGKTVDTPRAVMDALRDRPADSAVAVEYLRDRVSAKIQLKVPKAMAFPVAPPAPPHPPKVGAAAPTHRRIVLVDDAGRVQTWEDDGNGAVPMPSAPPAPPAPPVPPPPPRVD